MARYSQYTPEKLMEKITEYFEKFPKEGSLPSKAGLLLHLDLCRQTWANYKARKEFIDTIKRAELCIETAWVNRLTSNSPVGAIFYLKNAFRDEYKDKHETDITSGGKPLAILDALRHNNSDKTTPQAEPED